MLKVIEQCDCNAIHINIVNLVKTKTITDNNAYELSNFFKALGDMTRIRIMNALFIHEMCVCDLAVLLNMTKSAISHQLKYLRDVNLVKSRKIGKNVFYSLSDNHVEQIFKKGMEHISE